MGTQGWPVARAETSGDQLLISFACSAKELRCYPHTFKKCGPFGNSNTVTGKNRLLDKLCL